MIGAVPARFEGHDARPVDSLYGWGATCPSRERRDHSRREPDFRSNAASNSRAAVASRPSAPSLSTRLRCRAMILRPSATCRRAVASSSSMGRSEATWESGHRPKPSAKIFPDVVSIRSESIIIGRFAQVLGHNVCLRFREPMKLSSNLLISFVFRQYSSNSRLTPDF